MVEDIEAGVPVEERQKAGRDYGKTKFVQILEFAVWIQFFVGFIICVTGLNGFAADVEVAGKLTGAGLSQVIFSIPGLSAFGYGRIQFWLLYGLLQLFVSFTHIVWLIVACVAPSVGMIVLYSCLFVFHLGIFGSTLKIARIRRAKDWVREIKGPRSFSWAVMSAATYPKDLEEFSTSSVIKPTRRQRRKTSSTAGSVKSSAASKSCARSKTSTAPLHTAKTGAASKVSSGKTVSSKSIITASKSEKKEEKKKEGPSETSNTSTKLSQSSLAAPPLRPSQTLEEKEAALKKSMVLSQSKRAALPTPRVKRYYFQEYPEDILSDDSLEDIAIKKETTKKAPPKASTAAPTSATKKTLLDRVAHLKTYSPPPPPSISSRLLATDPTQPATVTTPSSVNTAKAIESTTTAVAITPATSNTSVTVSTMSTPTPVVEKK